MGFIKYRFFSKILGMETEVNLVLPDVKLLPGERYPVLYLLHGAGGDCDSWMRNSSIERYAGKNQLAVVMPSAYNSCYADMVHGICCFTYLSEELPNQLESLFPIANQPENRFVAGLSMGGRGAFLWAMRRPDFFRGAVCLSGSLDIVSMARRMEEEENEAALERFSNAFGNVENLAPENDVYLLAHQLSKKADSYPKFLYMCGLEDVRYKEQFLPFLSYCKEIGFEMNSLDSHGDHNFDYWDSAIEQAIQWMKHLGRGLQNGK